MTLPTDHYNLVALYHSADEDEHAYGHAWYAEAHDIAVRLASEHGVTVDQAAGVIAALSPQVSWPENQRRAAQLLRTGDTVGFTNGRDKAKRIVDGEDPADVLNTGHGPKSLAFYSNIANPDTSTAVTIDRHAFDAAIGRRTDDTTRRRVLDRKGAYESCAMLYRKAAAELGILPHVLQAVVWVVWRNQHSYFAGLDFVSVPAGYAQAMNPGTLGPIEDRREF